MFHTCIHIRSHFGSSHFGSSHLAQAIFAQYGLHHSCVLRRLVSCISFVSYGDTVMVTLPGIDGCDQLPDDHAEGVCGRSCWPFPVTLFMKWVEGDFFRKVSVGESLLVPGDPVHEGGLCSDFFRKVSVSESPLPGGLVMKAGCAGESIG